MITSETQLKKLDKLKDRKCPVCGQLMYRHDALSLEYVKTRRGTEFFIHTDCVKEWNK